MTAGEPLKLLEYDDSNVDDLSDALMRQVTEQRHRIHQVLGEDIDIAVADSRYGYAHRLVKRYRPSASGSGHD